MERLTELRSNGQSLIVDAQNGALLKSLKLTKNGDAVELLQLDPWPDFQSAWLLPFPNRLAKGSYQFEGKSYQLECNDPGHDNALHGLFWDESYEIVEQSEAAIRLRFDYKGNRAEYPFPFRFEVSYSFTHDGLSIALHYENTGTTNAPFGLGWHPYFAAALGIDVTEFQMPEAKRVLVDDKMIPTGEKVVVDQFKEPIPLTGTLLDDCFELENDRFTSVRYRVDLTNTLFMEFSSRDFPYLQVFTAKNRRSLAIEPMTCSIDAFNNGDGLLVFAPGESKQWKVYLSLF